jgi:hypothetical protein
MAVLMLMGLSRLCLKKDPGPASPDPGFSSLEWRLHDFFQLVLSFLTASCIAQRRGANR